jgi:hypothetical protein
MAACAQVEIHVSVGELTFIGVCARKILPHVVVDSVVCGDRGNGETLVECVERRPCGSQQALQILTRLVLIITFRYRSFETIDVSRSFVLLPEFLKFHLELLTDPVHCVR